MFAGGFNDLIHNFTAGVPLILCKLLVHWLKKRKKENLLSYFKQILCTCVFVISTCRISYVARAWHVVLCRDVW